MTVTVGTTLFILLLGFAAWSDVRTRRITNRVTVAAFALALLLRALAGGDFLLEGLLGAGLGFMIMLPLFAIGGVGGGDAKLLIAAGAFLGPMGFLTALFATALAGGVLSLVVAAQRGILPLVLQDTGDLMKYWLTLGRRGERRSLATPDVLSVPYGVAIGVGCIATLFLRGGL